MSLNSTDTNRRPLSRSGSRILDMKHLVETNSALFMLMGNWL